MSGESGDFSVYGEAKGEYTRQLCVFLVPTLETYMLDMLKEAKEEAPTPNKILWQFQTMLQGIPDWNQDKVLRETEKIQKDCPCDYLEELITAVFIAHTKVLSAIRLTTKQKKLQITIPKIDHFLHRVLSDCARSLWTNAYLFADSNSIEKQKNLRQVSFLLNDSVLQAIRGLLPVKSILREYLHEDEEEAKDADVEAPEPVSAPVALEVEVKEPVVEAAVEAKEPEVEAKEPAVEAKEPVVEVKEPVVEAKEAVVEVKEPAVEAKESETRLVLAPAKAPEPAEPAKPAEEKVNVIHIETKPTVTFSTNHVLFDSDVLEENGLQDIPFADEPSFTESSEELPMDFDEELE
jgi:outer membrane biosynthesis protein TonB